MSKDIVRSLIEIKNGLQKLQNKIYKIESKVKNEIEHLGELTMNEVVDVNKGINIKDFVGYKWVIKEIRSDYPFSSVFYHICILDCHLHFSAKNILDLKEEPFQWGDVVIGHIADVKRTEEGLCLTIKHYRNK